MRARPRRATPAPPRRQGRVPARQAPPPRRACCLCAAPRASFRLEGAAERRLRRGEASNRYAIGRAGNVVEPGLVAEEHRRRIAAMLAANAELELGPSLAPALAGDLDQLAHPLRVQRGERIVLEDATLLVLLQERGRIVAAQPEGGLGEIVRAEREE